MTNRDSHWFLVPVSSFLLLNFFLSIFSIFLREFGRHFYCVVRLYLIGVCSSARLAKLIFSFTSHFLLLHSAYFHLVRFLYAVHKTV
jgi:hypothetical protein